MTVGQNFLVQNTETGLKTLNMFECYDDFVYSH